MSTIRQELIYYPDAIEIGDGGRRVLLDVPNEPWRLFTLVMFRDPDKSPALPIDTSPRTVWPEDVGHDWTWRDGRLRYTSHVTGGRVWLLLEYDR